MKRQADIIRKMFADEGRAGKDGITVPNDFVARLEKKLALDSPKVHAIANDMANTKPRLAELVSMLTEAGLDDEAASLAAAIAAIETIWRGLLPEGAA